MAIKKSQLYSTIWKSCNELRGGMDVHGFRRLGGRAKAFGVDQGAGLVGAVERAQGLFNERSAAGADGAGRDNGMP